MDDCKVCKYIPSNDYDLERHFSNTHPGFQPGWVYNHPCKTCGSRTSNENHICDYCHRSLLFYNVLEIKQKNAI